MRVIDVLNSPWAIIPEKLLEIRAIYETHLRGEKIDIKAVEARLGQPLANRQTNYRVERGVAVIEMDGVIAKKMNMFTRISGGVSTQLVARDVKDAIDNPGVNSILLVIDSPGGTVDGTQELAHLVHQAAAIKPVVAYADGLMASAAYYIGAAAGQVFISGDNTLTGSIGVVTTHVDYSGMEQRMGVKTTEIYAGKYKRIASDVQPLSDEGRSYLQAQVDRMYETFVNDVARFRAVSPETVLEDMADGRIWIGRQGIDQGLADGMATLDEVVGRMAAGEFRAREETARSRATVLPAGVPRTVIGASIPGATSAGVAAARAIPHHEEQIMTKEEILAKHPEAATALHAEGHAQGKQEGYQAGLKEGLEQGRQEGAKAERERIQAVQAQSMPGHEALIEQLKFDGKTTGPEAAVQVLAAEKGKLGKQLQDLQADAADIKTPPAQHGNLAGGEPPANLAGLSDEQIKETCTREWQADLGGCRTRAGYMSIDGYIAARKREAAQAA